MNFMELARHRYATKRYSSGKKVPDEFVDQLKEILRLSPSSIYCQPWRFTFVQNPALKDRLARVSMHNEHKIQQCGLLPAPGHTLGHLSVAIEDGENLVLILGDAAYSEQALLHGVVDGVTQDYAAHQDSTRRPAVVLCAQDPASDQRLQRRQTTTIPPA